MDQEKVNYIVKHYGNLLSPEEKHQIEVDVVRLALGTSKAVADYEKQYNLGLFTEQEEYLDLVGMTAIEFNSIVATRVLCEYKDQIFFNYCARCNALARTPLSKQCRHCGYDWH